MNFLVVILPILLAVVSYGAPTAKYTVSIFTNDLKPLPGYVKLLAYSQEGENVVVIEPNTEYDIGNLPLFNVTLKIPPPEFRSVGLTWTPIKSEDSQRQVLCVGISISSQDGKINVMFATKTIRTYVPAYKEVLFFKQSWRSRL